MEKEVLNRLHDLYNAHYRITKATTAVNLAIHYCEGVIPNDSMKELTTIEKYLTKVTLDISSELKQIRNENKDWFEE